MTVLDLAALVLFVVSWTVFGWTTDGARRFGRVSLTRLMNRHRAVLQTSDDRRIDHPQVAAHARPQPDGAVAVHEPREADAAETPRSIRRPAEDDPGNDEKNERGEVQHCHRQTPSISGLSRL